MVFTTQVFLFYFLPAVLIVYYALQWSRQLAMRTLALTVASYLFYGWTRTDYLFLILGSTCLDYTCGRIGGNKQSRHRLAALLTSIVGNLGLLAYFKYFNFGMDTTNTVLDMLGYEPLQYAKVALPVGISFYTFQTMSYTIDIYRGDAKRASSFLDVACYVALFPQLVAGPIVRYRDLSEQLHHRVHSLERFGHGALLFMCGFAKKILIADAAGRMADSAFNLDAAGLYASWIGILAYSVQIYFDFSGYSDMAIGLGRMFGFEFPLNFASPYRSKSITEFWRRWHISLSTWLRDYLYIPLGGNQKGPRRTYINLMLTMLLGGLWHGAQWTFVAWGAFHGIMLAMERWSGKRAPWSFLPSFLQVALTFVLVMMGWVLFRAKDMGNAGHMFSGMAGLNGLTVGWESVAFVSKVDLVLSSIGLFLCWAGVQSDVLVAPKRPWLAGLVCAFLFAVFVVAIGHMFYQANSPFLYFQF